MCYICKYYGYTLEDVKKLTFKELNSLSSGANKITLLENPDMNDETSKNSDGTNCVPSVVLGKLVSSSRKNDKRKKGKT